MRVAIMLGIVGLALVGFGFWGLNTARGRRTFDEMAGMIPLAALATGGLALLIAIFWGVYRIRRG